MVDGEDGGARVTRRFALAAAVVALAAVGAQAQSQASDSVRRAAECASCAEWNAPQRPFRLQGNTWYVGTHGLAALLLTSDSGHVLIDGALPESAPQILANIRALGFRVEDVKLLVNSHVHFDHAGGLAAVQRASGARVMASASSAAAMRRGMSGPDDPQYGVLLPYPAVENVGIVRDGEALRVGPIALTAHLTPGHTPGGTSWSWRSCDSTCLDFVYADSQTPVSADGFRYTSSATYPAALADFARGQAVLEGLSCDVLVTPHPSASSLWERVAAGTLVDRDACRKFAAAARARVAERVARESR